MLKAAARAARCSISVHVKAVAMGTCAQRGEPQERHVHECLFPMYVVKASGRCLGRRALEVRDFLEMGVPESHHVLLRKGLLHKWRPGMSVIFVSHQWLARNHPDPFGQHAAVLRGILQGVLDGGLVPKLRFGALGHLF